jgi:hypothetical protein
MRLRHWYTRLVYPQQSPFLGLVQFFSFLSMQ